MILLFFGEGSRGELESRDRSSRTLTKVEATPNTVEEDEGDEDVPPNDLEEDEKVLPDDLEEDEEPEEDVIVGRGFLSLVVI